MINKLSFEIEHIKQISDRTRKDPILIEKMVYALGLLEILCLSNLSFIFKGGTSLILLLKIPKRFSTDIDILVKSEEEFDLILKNLNHYFPFKRYEEQHRQQNGSKLIKRHFKFYYESPIRKCESNILLDILIEKADYLSLRSFDIINDFILMEGVPSQVLIPKIECILGDKLTAFAPKTTGILFGRGKSLEIIKQFYDIGVLYESSEDYDLVIRTYKSVVKEEINYRSLTCDIKDVLKDSFLATLTICSRGKLGYSSEYKELEEGIKCLQEHIFTEKFTIEKAVHHACEILYIYARMLNDKPIDKINDFESYEELLILNPQYNVLNKIKKISLNKFAYVYEAIKSFE